MEEKRKEVQWGQFSGRGAQENIGDIQEEKV